MPLKGYKARFNIYFFQLVTKIVSFQFNCKNNPKYFARPGSKKSIIRKTARYDRIINELCHFYKVSLIKTGLMFHKYHLLNKLQVFMRYKKLPK
jgi:hypothetical protein